MRSSLILSAAISASTAVLLAGSNTLADDAPATQAAPPTEVAYVPQTASVSVMVLPFHLTGNTADGAWISQAIDEDLRTDLMKNPSVSLVPAPAKLPETPGDALQTGLWANAKYVIYGTYQLVNGQVRVTGSIIGVGDGKVIAPLSATGDLRDLFKIEDALSAQVQQVLPAPPAAQAQAYAEPAPITTYYYPDESSTAYSGYEYPSPSVEYYPAAPAYYGYGWPYYGGVGIIVGGGFDHRGFDHGFDHHGFGNGGHFGNTGGFGGGGIRGGFIGGGVRGGGFGGFHGSFGGGFHAGGFGGGHR